MTDDPKSPLSIEQLALYFAGELDSDRKRAFEDFLDYMPDAKTYVESLRPLLAKSIEELPGVEVPTLEFPRKTSSTAEEKPVAQASLSERPSSSTRPKNSLSRRTFFAASAASGVAVGVVGGNAYASGEYKERIRNLEGQLRTFKQMKKDLGLDSYVRFISDDDPSNSIDPKSARPFFVAGHSLRTMGWVNGKLIRRLDIYVDHDFRTRDGDVTTEKESAKGVSFPESEEDALVAFNEEIPLPPLDDRTREVMLQLIPRPAAQDAAGEILREERLTYRRYIKSSIDYGPLPVDPNAGGKPLSPKSGIVDVNRYFVPSGISGDVSDVAISFGSEGGHRFIYEPQGRGPHERGKSKYDAQGHLNDSVCGFAGCFWLNPANNWGTVEGGFDLRDFRPREVAWTARSLGEPIQVEFLVGSEGQVWVDSDGEKPKWTEPEYANTLSTFRLGQFPLEAEWKTYRMPLEDISVEQFKRVIAGFAWSITSGVEKDRKFEFEVKDIKYTNRYEAP